MTTPINDQPVLPLDAEAQIAVRNLRVIAGQVDGLHAAALHDLADGLERSLNHNSGI